MSKRQLERKRRGIIIYSFTGLFLSAGLVYLLFSLSSLILPLVTGSLLAYIFKPLIRSKILPWLPQQVRAILVLAGLILFIFVGVRYIKDILPNKQTQAALMTKIHFQLTSKIDDLLGYKEKKEGNALGKLLSKESYLIKSGLDEVFKLNKDQKDWAFAYFSSSNSTNAQLYLESLNSHPVDIELLPEENSETIESSPSSHTKTSFAAKLASTLSSWLVMPFVFIFLLFDQGGINQYFMKYIPNRYFEVASTVLEEAEAAIGKYLRGTILECSMVGLTMIIGLTLIGFEFKIAVLIGLLAGATNAIPFLGPAMGLLFGLFYALIAESVSPILPFISIDNLYLGVFVTVLITQMLDNIYFQPVILGSAVNLHPLVVIIGVMGGSTLFGVSGMLLAIPTIVVFKVVFETFFENLKDYQII